MIPISELLDLPVVSCYLLSETGSKNKEFIIYKNKENRKISPLFEYFFESYSQLNNPPSGTPTKRASPRTSTGYVFK